MVDPERLWIRCWAAVTTRSARALSSAIAWSVSASRAISRPGLLVALLIVLAPLCLILLQPASKAIGPSTITVNTTDDPGTSTECSLRAAINNANNQTSDSNSTCAPGTGQDTINFNITGSGTVTLGSTLPAIANTSPGSLTIDGTGETITVDGANAHAILAVNSGATLHLDNLTIAHGNSSSEGGGIDNEGTLTVSNVIFSDNSAFDGGGIWNQGALTVTNGTFSGNSANNANGSGGGIGGNNSGATATVTGSTFSGNNVNFGGGAIFNNNSGTTTVKNCTFSGNDAGFGGGSIDNPDSNFTITVTNSILFNNTGGRKLPRYDHQRRPQHRE